MTSLNRFRIASLAFMVGFVLMLGASRSANAQTAEMVESAFTPFVAPRLTVQQSSAVTLEQRLCAESANAPRPSEATVAIQAPQVLTPLNMNSYADNPYFAEGLYRWIAGELARNSVFSRPMTSAELLVLVRRTYTPRQVVQRLCAHVSGVCRPMFLWRATFLRDPWCAAVDRGEVPFPSASSVLAGTLEGNVCLGDPAPGVRSSYLPCPTLNRIGFIRVLSRSMHGGQPVLPSGETIANDAYDTFRFGGMHPSGATGWGGGGTGERPLALDEYVPTDDDHEDELELDQYDESSSRRDAHHRRGSRQRQSSFPIDENQW